LKLDKKLNLVIPIERGDPVIKDDGSVTPNVAAYVFSIPISQPAFEINYNLIARTFTKITTGGFGTVAGPRTAAMLMRATAKEMGDEAAATNLQTEINRLSMFAFMGKGGWEKLPLAEALTKKLLDEDESSEVENALAFFIVASSMYRKSENRALMLGLASLWGALPTASTFTDFLASLTTSIETAPSIKKAVSSVPR
jgi:hypothetical protein